MMNHEEHAHHEHEAHDVPSESLEVIHTLQDSHHSSHQSMRMTFSSVWDYKVQLLFDDWTVTTPSQYFVAWFIVFIVMIFSHYLKYVITCIEVYLDPRNHSTDMMMGGQLLQKLPFRLIHSLKLSSSYLRYVHSLLSSLNYLVCDHCKVLCVFLNAYLLPQLGLMLMLVAMTYNTGLVVALTAGYCIGHHWSFHWRETLSQHTSHSFSTLKNSLDGDGCHD